MKSRIVTALIAAVCATALLPACSGSKGSAVSFSKIEVDQPTTIDVDTSTITIGDVKAYTFRVQNTGKAKILTVSDVRLDYTPVTEEETTDPEGPAFKLSAVTLPAQIAPKGEGGGEIPETLVFTVYYKRYNDSENRSAKLTIANDNTQEQALRNYVFNFSTKACSPTLDVRSVLDFGAVKKGETQTKYLDLYNVGNCELGIDWITFESDDPNFTIQIGDKVYKTDETHEQEPVAIKVEPNGSTQWVATFSPQSGNPAKAKLVIHPTNDVSAPEGRTVELLANDSAPCIKVTPSKVEFGGRLIGKTAQIDVTIKSCSTGALELTGIALKEGASPDFMLDPGLMANGQFPTEEAKVILAVNDETTFSVKCTPDVKNPTDPATGKPIPDTALIVINNNSFDGALELEVSCFGVEVECPMPIIVVEEGEEVPPQTVLHLHGDQSQAASGDVASYHWSVAQPAENKFNLAPTAKFVSPTHEVNVGGTYTYCLDVCDAQYCSNDPKCMTTACKEVNVLIDKAIHCELTWKTPGDFNEFDDGPDAGSDMDIHFVHPFATGPDLDGDGKPDGWFDVPYDTFWFNESPELESMNPNAKDDPTLDRDDTDGAGPENVNLDSPVEGRQYKVGVHYWDDHGYGFSYPRLKCYVLGQLVYDMNLEDMGQKMFRCDMWEALTIDWPTGKATQVTNSDGSLKITNKYVNPAFVQIGGGSCE